MVQSRQGMIWYEIVARIRNKKESPKNGYETCISRSFITGKQKSETGTLGTSESRWEMIFTTYGAVFEYHLVLFYYEHLGRTERILRSIV